MDTQNKQPKIERRRTSSAVIHEINARLDRGDARFEKLEANLTENTIATRQIAENTAGIVRLTTELEAGTKFLCRVALAVRFILNMFVRATNEVIKPLWLPALIASVVIYYITHHHQLPDWLPLALKAVLA